MPKNKQFPKQFMLQKPRLTNAQQIKCDESRIGTESVPIFYTEKE